MRQYAGIDVFLEPLTSVSWTLRANPRRSIAA